MCRCESDQCPHILDSKHKEKLPLDFSHCRTLGKCVNSMNVGGSQGDCMDLMGGVDAQYTFLKFDILP